MPLSYWPVRGSFLLFFFPPDVCEHRPWDLQTKRKGRGGRSYLWINQLQRQDRRYYFEPGILIITVIASRISTSWYLLPVSVFSFRISVSTPHSSPSGLGLARPASPSFAPSRAPPHHHKPALSEVNYFQMISKFLLSPSRDFSLFPPTNPYPRPKIFSWQNWRKTRRIKRKYIRVREADYFKAITKSLGVSQKISTYPLTPYCKRYNYLRRFCSGFGKASLDLFQSLDSPTTDPGVQWFLHSNLLGFKEFTSSFPWPQARTARLSAGQKGAGTQRRKKPGNIRTSVHVSSWSREDYVIPPSLVPTFPSHQQRRRSGPAYQPPTPHHTRPCHSFLSLLIPEVKSGPFSLWSEFVFLWLPGRGCIFPKLY